MFNLFQVLHEYLPLVFKLNTSIRIKIIRYYFYTLLHAPVNLKNVVIPAQTGI